MKEVTFKIWHRHYNIFFGKSCRQLIKAVIGQNFFNIICFVKASQMRCLSQWYLFFLLLGDVVSDISFTLTLNAQLLHIADIPGARMIKVKTLHLQELLSPKDCLLMFWGAWWYLKKWNFFVAFSMKGGVLHAINVFQECFFCKNHNYSLTVKVCFAYSLGFISYTYSCGGDHGYGWIY